MPTGSKIVPHTCCWYARCSATRCLRSSHCSSIYCWRIDFFSTVVGELVPVVLVVMVILGELVLSVLPVVLIGLVVDNLVSTARIMEEISVSIFTYCRRRLNGIEGEVESEYCFSDVFFFEMEEEEDEANTPIFPISFSKNSLNVIAMVVLEITSLHIIQVPLTPNLSACYTILHYQKQVEQVQWILPWSEFHLLWVSGWSFQNPWGVW